MTAVEFPPSLFADPSRAQRNLQSIHEMFIASGSYFSLDEFSNALQAQMAISPDADQATTQFLRFCESTVSKASLFNDLLKYPVTLEVLLKLFGQSQFFSDILVRDPELFRWLTASDVLMKRQQKADLDTEVRRIEKTFSKPERRLDALRRLYRREILRIGARDILGNADLQTVTAELSELADVLIDASCRITETVLKEKYEAIPDTPYAVIGLGKLGGSELNYSSDIDIMFVYGDEGELARNLTYHEYFNKFVERMVQNLSQSSGEGHIYRVDTRLRPESGMGPLARSVQSFLLYYESRGEVWERQMLIKARAVAGDLEFGEKFLTQLTPFVYPRTFFTHPSESIARIKARIEVAVAGEDNIKLQAGGIRDIEFVAQALQLFNGGKRERIRSRSTLHALSALHAEGLLSEEENKVLSEAYAFFRTLEHRLQVNMNTQTHAIPIGEHERATLAKKLGLSSAIDLSSRIEQLKESVREVYDDVLTSGDGGKAISGIDAVIDGGGGEEEMEKVLRSFGFQDLRRASRNLRTILSGSGRLDGIAADVRTRNAFREISREVFARISSSPSPDYTLNNFAALLSTQTTPESLFSALKEKQFQNLVFTVCGASSLLARGLSKDRLLLELLASNADALSSPWNGRKRRGETLAEMKQREELRAGVRHILGITDFLEFTNEITAIADRVVKNSFNTACRAQSLSDSPLALFALGKYGTREMIPNADLDVLFVGEQGSKTMTDKLEKVASGMIRHLTAFAEGGNLYDIDARLRPEGRSAPLVVEKKSYLKYLIHRASLWERQSLTRLRFVCGNTTVRRAVEQEVDSFVYSTPLPDDWGTQIVEMRRKMESRSHTRSAGFFDIKLGIGGMVDIEFIAQMIQLRYGQSISSLKHLPTVQVLQASPKEVVNPESAMRLASMYQFYRRVELMMRLSLEERSTVLPLEGKLDLLARVLGEPSGTELGDRVDKYSKNVRSQFLEIAQTLSV